MAGIYPLGLGQTKRVRNRIPNHVLTPSRPPSGESFRRKVRDGGGCRLHALHCPIPQASFGHARGLVAANRRVAPPRHAVSPLFGLHFEVSPVFDRSPSPCSNEMIARVTINKQVPRRRVQPSARRSGTLFVPGEAEATDVIGRVVDGSSLPELVCVFYVKPRHPRPEASFL